MTFGYLQVPGTWLEHIFKSGYIEPPLLRSFLQHHTEQEARRLLQNSREGIYCKIDELEQAALKRPDMFEGMKKEGVTTEIGMAFYVGTHSRDQKVRQLLSGIDLQQNYVMLYSTIDEANAQAHFSKRAAILQVKLPEDSCLEKITGIGSVYLVIDEVPTEKIYRVHASNITLARKVLEENGSNAELTLFGAITAEQ